VVPAARIEAGAGLRNPPSKDKRGLVLLQALHEVRLALATGGALVIFLRVCLAALRVDLRFQIANFNFSFFLLRRFRLAVFIGHNLTSPPAAAENIRGHIINQHQSLTLYAAGVLSP